MNKKEYKAYIEKEYENDPEGFAIYLNLLFEHLKSINKRQLIKKIKIEGS